MVRNGDVMLTGPHGRQTHVRSLLPGHFVTKLKQSVSKFTLTNPSAASYRQNLVPNNMQSNQSGTLSLLKVTVDRLAHVASQFLQSLGLSEDAVSHCPGCQTTFICLFNNN